MLVAVLAFFFFAWLFFEQSSLSLDGVRAALSREPSKAIGTKPEIS